MNNDLLQAITLLDQLPNHRVLHKYQKPDFYNSDSDTKKQKFIGVFLDIEATGLSYTHDKLIELAIG